MKYKNFRYASKVLNHLAYVDEVRFFGLIKKKRLICRTNEGFWVIDEPLPFNIINKLEQEYLSK